MRRPTPVVGVPIGGARVDAARTYRITVNSFLAGGGDLFTILPQGADLTGGLLDLDALEAYLRPSLSGAPLAVPATDRIAVVP